MLLLSQGRSSIAIISKKEEPYELEKMAPFSLFGTVSVAVVLRSCDGGGNANVSL
jgi:hypothetical protein